MNCPKHAEFFFSKNKFEKLVHLVGFIIRIYHDAPSTERHTLLYTQNYGWWKIYVCDTVGLCSMDVVCVDSANMYVLLLCVNTAAIFLFCRRDCNSRAPGSRKEGNV